MEKTPKLQFPPIKLSAIERDGKTLVLDTIRNIYVVLTPEEWVRRHAVEFLMTHCRVPRLLITEEFPVNINSTAQRADIVVFDRQAHPFILVECKAPHVKITRQVIDQALRYNAVVQARYIAITNGLKHYCLERVEDEYRQISRFPSFE